MSDKETIETLRNALAPFATFKTKEEFFENGHLFYDIDFDVAHDVFQHTTPEHA